MLLSTAVAITGPALFLLYPSQLMFWLSGLFLIPGIAYFVYLDIKADEAGKGKVGDATAWAHPDIWGAPPGL